jgi:hypothetical protein
LFKAINDYAFKQLDFLVGEYSPFHLGKITHHLGKITQLDHLSLELYCLPVFQATEVK